MIYYIYMTSMLDQSKLSEFCKTHHIAYLGVFGSASRGELTPKSDVDFLVRYQKEVSLLDHVGIQLDRYAPASGTRIFSN